MNEDEVRRYITETFEGVDVVIDSGNNFFFYNPNTSVPPDHKFPFVTLVTNDLYDQFSDLNRPSVFRLNIGISKQTFSSLFGPGLPKLPSDMDTTTESDNDGDAESDYDFTALDQIMPHPVYGRMYWVCVLSPGEQTFQTTVQPLLAEAYETAAGMYERKAAGMYERKAARRGQGSGLGRQ